VGRELFELRLTPIRMGLHAFRTPTATHPDYPALQIMRELLYNEQNSGLLDELEREGKILGAHWYSTDFADHGLDVIFVAPRILGQTFENAEHRALEQIDRVARGEFDEPRMIAIRDNLFRAEDRQWESNEERALALADAFIRHDGWQGYLEYRERLAGVSREDVMRVAGTYFGDDYLALRSRVGFPKRPRLDKPSYPTVAPRPNVHSSFYQHIMTRPSPAPRLRFVDFAADVTTTQVAENVVLRSNPNPFNDTYTLSLVFGVGTVRIRELFVAAEYLERIGTRSYSPAALHEQLSLLGTNLTTSVTDDRLHVQLTGPEQHLPAALALLDELLREPVADERLWKALRRERAMHETATREFTDNVRDALLHYVMFGERSQFLRDYGRRGARSLSPEKLIAAWQRAQSYGLEIRYTGQRAPEEVAEILERSLAGSLDVPREPAVPYVVRERDLPERDTVYFMPQRKQVQTQLVFVVDGEPVPREQVAAADAFGTYMSGLTYQEIIDFRALAYSASAYYIRSRDRGQPGWFGGWIACQADKTFDSIDVMMGLIRETPAKPERADSVRAMLSRSLELQSPGFRDFQDQLEAWRRLGYDDDPRKLLIDDHAKLEFADIQAFHAAHVADRPVILVVVGDPRRVDVGELERYGEVIEVAEREMFAR
jgi:zinc protease